MCVSAIEMAAFSPELSRMYTAPNLPTRVNSRNPYSNGMGHGPRASQLSGTTTVTSTSSTSLATISSPPSNAGPVLATNNIINQKADASKSLYQICVTLRQRLRQVPGFEQHLIDSDDEDEGGEMEMDPMSSLWRCLRKGYPLMTIYNCLQPPNPLQIAEGTVAARNIPKSAAFKFVQACLMELKFEECFVLTDLFGDDTTGFVKVTQVINRVLDVAESRGLLLTSDVEAVEDPVDPAGTQMSYRDHVVRELVDTERKYVQDLENLHELKKVVEQRGVITGDVVHDIFLNINAILDFQRRFLIRIETTNSQPESKQEWGLIFVNYEEAFGIYQPFIANQRKAATIAKREFDKISLADHPVVVDFNTLDGFLLKPMQRLIKYPQLLKSLRDKTTPDEQTKADLSAGISAAERVLEQANAAVDRELRNEALADLCTQVEDWKNHEVGQFGDLLLYGQFFVLTGKSDVEKEYSIYLFERILLCCKDAYPNKAAKDKLLGNQKEKKEKKDKDKSKKDKGGKSGKLQLKGRIFMTNVTDVVSLVKPGSYTVQIWWKGDPGIENFIIRFTNDEVMKKWSTAVDAQRKLCAADREQSAGADVTDFTWMREQAIQIPNPYAQQEDDDDDDEPPINNTTYPSHSSFESSRNISSTSLRSRSTTGDSAQSLAGMVRSPPPRFPIGPQNPPLSVQTEMQNQTPSFSQRGGESYFSPTTDSPASSRTSQTSSMFPYSRQGTPQSGWEEHARYTAPAMARAPSRESQGPTGNYSNGRGQRPSLSTTSSQNSPPTVSQQRNRSYSTPDINGPNGPTRRLPNGNGVPAVPGIPAHLHPAYDGGISRSSNNSPINGLPMRSNTQSPGVQRERLAQHLNAPQYIRANTTLPPTSAPSTMDGRTMSPPLPSSTPGIGEIPLPTQLKVKVNCDGNYVTLVVAFNITYQSLIDRIDAKVGRFSNNAIARGTMRLRYRDEDGDFVTIESDEDIQIAFQEWREAQKSQFHTGQLGEIELFCASVEN